ncbi:MAG: hypothetical protein BGO27_05540 [Alphaproteobacteria bacterium 33-17]|nr:MAG: hypothetical protein BGO27_05540 [Alphaproteobacteria bacterium 33-17]
MFGELGIFDYIIVSIVVLSLLIGFFKGFIATTLSLVRLVLSFISATMLSQYTLLFIDNKIPNKDIAEYVAFIATYIITYLLISIAKYYVTSLFETLNKGAVDRMMGSLFGLIRGIAISCFIFVCILGITGSLNVKHSNDIYKIQFHVKHETEPKWLQNSAMQPKLTEFSKMLISYMPASWWYKLESYIVTKKMQAESFNDPNTELLESIIKDSSKKKEINELLNKLKNSNDSKSIQDFRDLLNKDDIHKNFSYDEFKNMMKILDKLEINANEGK